MWSGFRDLHVHTHTQKHMHLIHNMHTHIQAVWVTEFTIDGLRWNLDSSLMDMGPVFSECISLNNQACIHTCCVQSVVFLPSIHYPFLHVCAWFQRITYKHYPIICCHNNCLSGLMRLKWWWQIWTEPIRWDPKANFVFSKRQNLSIPLLQFREITRKLDVLNRNKVVGAERNFNYF